LTLNGAVRALKAPDHGLEVLVAVVEVQRHVVLARLVAGEVLALGVQPEAAVEEGVGEASGPLGELRVGPGAIAPDDRRSVGVRSGDRFVDLGQVERHR
jgi:hypothetical protein